MIGPRRDKYSIIFEILEAARNDLPITRIMYSTNLNYKQIKKYLDLCLEADFIRKTRGTYFITERGSEVLPILETITEKRKKIEKIRQECSIMREKMESYIKIEEKENEIFESL